MKPKPRSLERPTLMKTVASCILISLLSFVSAVARTSADQITFTQSYLRSLHDANVPTFVASCTEKGGKAVLVVAVGHSDGMLLEYEGKELINPSTVKVSGGTLTIDQTNGGQWSLERASRLLGAIQHRPFVLLESGEIDRLNEIQPEGRCEFPEPD